jgi:hypothetical protein
MSTVPKTTPKITIKRKVRPALPAKSEDAEGYVPLIDNEAELDYDIDEDGNAQEIEKKTSVEDEKKKQYKKLKNKKQKMSKKGFEVVETFDAIAKKDKLDLRRHINLRGNEDEDLDGVTEDPYRTMLEAKQKNKADSLSSGSEVTKNPKRKSDDKASKQLQSKKQKLDTVMDAAAPKESKKGAQKKGKKAEKKSFLSQEKSSALSLLNEIASKQEEWAETQVQKSKGKEEARLEKERLRQEHKLRKDKMKKQAMEEALLKAKQARDKSK